MDGPPRRRFAVDPGSAGRTRLPLVLLAVAVAVLEGLPAGALGTVAPTAPPHSASHRPHVAGSALADSGPETRLAAGLPGRFVDAPAIFRQDHTRVVAGEKPTDATPSPTGSPGAYSRPSAPALGAPAVSDGWLSGTVVDSVYRTPVVGANVTPSSANLSCAPVCTGTTNASGFFRVAGPPGATELSFDAAGDVANSTIATILAGIVTSVGTVELVHDGYVAGTVVGDLPGLPALANISVTSQSRDGQVPGPDSTVTTSNGSFRIAVDPIALEVDFAPARNARPGFLANATYADPGAWGVVDVGAIRLEGGLPATANVIDSVTGLSVPNVTAEFCSQRIDVACFGESFGNGSVTVITAPGPGFLAVSAPGYVTNVTQVPDLPADQSIPVVLPVVNLVPDGLVEVTVNFTFADPNSSWSPPGGFAFTILVCGLSGEQNGFIRVGSPVLGTPDCLLTPATLGATVLAPAEPLRDAVYIVRGYPVPGGMPIAEKPTPQIPLLYANLTWANVTPDRVTDLGSVDVLPGTYLAGSVSIHGSFQTAGGQNVTIQVCSTVRATICEPGVKTGPSGPGATPAGCPTAAWAFCAPSPPGPVRVTIGWGPASNATWVDVGYRCCAQQGRPTEIGTFSLAADVGKVNGTIGIIGQPAGVRPASGWSAGVEVCPAISLVLPCFEGSVSPTGGNFSLPAALGWDRITVSAVNFRENRTWVDVTASNSTGEVELTPYAVVTGKVVSATTGAPVVESFVQACNVVSDQCLPGWAEAGSNGTFSVSIPSYSYPAGTFGFVVTASGFDPETTFANVTAGGVTALPPIRLPPVGVRGGVAGRPGPHPSSSSTPTTGSWVTGRLVDANSGLGIGNAAITACQLRSSGGCAASFARTLSGGEFNLTTVHGAYEIWFNATHYPSDLVYLNASIAGTVALGDLRLAPYPRVVGRVLVDPWPSLADTIGEGADQARVVVCDARLQCGPYAITDSGGFFNVSAPVGGLDVITITGGGPVDWSGNGLPGFSLGNATVSVPSSGTRFVSTGPGGSFPLALLTNVLGTVQESGGGPARPAMFAAYGANSSIGGSVATYTTGSGGEFSAFIPAGGTSVLVRAAARALVPASVEIRNVTLVAGGTLRVGNVTTTRFGFVTATVRDASTGAPLGSIGLSVTASGGRGVYVSGSDASNGSGIVNVSAPPGPDVLGINDSAYAAWTGNATVTSAATTSHGPIDLSGLADGGVSIVRTAQVNTLAGPIVPGAFDNVSGIPVAGTAVLEGALGVHVGPLNGSDLGEFFFSVTPASSANLTIAANGFTTATFPENLPPGTVRVLQPLNLTPDGILTGTVVAVPGNVTVPYTTVSVCPVTAPNCPTTAETNATGVFWVGAPAGYDAVAVESQAYLTNLTPVVNVLPGSFVELGNVAVFGFGTVRGVVRGLPSGALLGGVNVSLCSPFSPPNGCFPDESVTTDPNGSFSIDSPPGVYFFFASLPGFNATRFALVLGAGANVDLGVVVLESYGIEAGTVVDPTGAPVQGAVVFSCASYLGGACAGPVSTGPTGAFRLVAPPGGNAITVSATGFLDSDVAATVVSGGLVDLPPIVLYPQPPDVFENVSGYVTAAASGAPIPGALVSALEGGARVGEAEVRANGFYDVIVRWGTVALLVDVPGYKAANRTLLVHAPVADVNFSLATMEFVVRGVAFDGGTNTVLADVTIAENGISVASTGPTGAFSLTLPNGTTSLTATHPPAGPVRYGPTTFTVTVTGGPASHDVTVPRLSVPLTGSVVDAATGQPLASARVVLWTPAGSEASNASTTGAGSFAFAVGPGRYNLSVEAPGYESINVTIATGPGGSHTAVALVATEPTRAPSTGFAPVVEVGLAAAVGLALLVGAAVRRRLGRPPGAPPSPGGDP